MKQWLDCKCADGFKDWSLLALRLVTGAVYVVHGYAKYQGMGAEGFANVLAGLGVPAPMVFSWLVLVIEIVGGAALMAGAWTHLAAKLTTIVGVAALLLVHIGKGFSVQAGGYEFVLLLVVAGLVLLAHGAGKYSVDGWRKQNSMGGGMM